MAHRRLVTPLGGEYIRPLCALGRHIHPRREANSALCTQAYSYVTMVTHMSSQK